MTAASCRVFITHSSLDKDLAEALVEALQLATRLPDDAIFCSSIDGIDVPSGEDFLDYIREQLDATTLVVPLITPAYLESLFCMWELGAIWAKGVKYTPIRFDPISPSDLPELLRHRQVKPLGVPALNAVVQAIASQAGIAINSDRWERHREHFLGTAQSMLPALKRHWDSSPAATQRRLAHVGESLEELRACLETIRDLAFVTFSDKELTGRTFRYLLRDVARSAALLFRTVTNVNVRVTIKQVIVLKVPAAEAWSGASRLGVEDLARDRGAPWNGVDRVVDNTDFNDILVNRADYFLSNDIDALVAARAYVNSHYSAGVSPPYKSTMVWPIRKLHEDPEDWLGSSITPGQDFVGFLCVDSTEKDVFGQPENELGRSVAAALYPVLRPFLFEDPDYEAPEPD